MWRDSQTRRRLLKGVGAGSVVSLALGARGIGSNEGTTGTDEGATGTDGGATVGILETSHPVETGDPLEVTAALENGGDADATETVRLVVGNDPEQVAEETVTVGAGTTETVTLGYETAHVENTQAFPVRVETNGGADERTVTVFGAADDGIARVRPISDEVTVQPGVPVFFEVAGREPLEYDDVEWTVEGGESSGDPLALDYTYETGTAAFLLSTETSGSYEVGARYSDETGSTTVEWTVDVTPDGRAQPTVVDLSTEPPADAVVGVDDAIEVTLTGRDDEGTLDRVIWQEGQNHTVTAVAPLAGTEDTATLSLENPGWISAGYPTMARVVCADGRLSELVTDDGPEVRPPFEVDIVDTNEPVTGGDRLEVTVDVENVGDMMMAGDTTQEIDLLVGSDPEWVDSETVTVDPFVPEQVVLGYETYPVEHDDEFPIRVESLDDSDERTVTVSGTGETGSSLDVTIQGTNDPVDAGDVLEVTATLENGGEAERTADVRLVVGHDPEVVATRTATVGPGERETTTLRFETAVVENDQSFPVRVETGDDAAERTVEVYGTN